MIAVVAGVTAVATAGAPAAPALPTDVTIPLLTTTTTAAPPPPTTEAPAATAPVDTTPTSIDESTVPTDVPSTDVPVTLADAGASPAPATASTPTVAPARAAPTGRTIATVPASSVSAALTGSYGVGLGTVLAVALVFFGFASRVRTGGPPVTETQRRWRLIGGFGCLGLAAIVGLVGYLKLSLEPAVNRQIPYLASAGMTLVLLAALGGSLLVAEQLRGDDRRIDELEAAVRHLASALAPSIEQPARRAVDHIEPPAVETVETPPKRTRRSPSS